MTNERTSPSPSWREQVKESSSKFANYLKIEAAEAEQDRKFAKNIKKAEKEGKQKIVRNRLEQYAGEIDYLFNSSARNAFEEAAECIREVLGEAEVVSVLPTEEDLYASPQLQLRFGFLPIPDGKERYSFISCQVDYKYGQIAGFALKDATGFKEGIAPDEELIGSVLPEMILKPMTGEQIIGTLRPDRV